MKFLITALCALLSATPALAKDAAKHKSTASQRAPKSEMPDMARGLPADMGAGEDDVSIEERVTLLKKFATYKGKVSGANRQQIRAVAKKLLADRDALAESQFACSRHNPTTDKGKIQIMDCTFFATDANGEDMVVNFGTNGWLAEVAKITDITMSEVPQRVGMPPSGNQETDEQPPRLGMPASH